MTKNLPFSEIDFETYKTNLKNYLKNQDRFIDYDFEASNMAVLIDILALNMFQQGTYNNMAFSEMFMDSVQLRDNAMSHAKELNYVPSSAVSAISKLSLSVSTSGLTPSSVTIPKGAKFRGTCGNTIYNFITDKSYTAIRANGTYTLTDVTVHEGSLQREFYTVDESKDQQFIITNENVDINSIKVYVRDNTLVSSTRNEYTVSSEIFGVESEDLTFYVAPHYDSLYKVEFGRNIFGNQPVNGNVIEIEYRVTKGLAANGSTNFNAVDTTIAGHSITVTSSIIAINGGDRETLEDIKFFAPKSAQIQERAVTRRDYEVLLKSKFPNIQAVTAFGGEELDPPRYGKVVVSVDVLGSRGASQSELREFTNYLRTKTPLTIEPIFTPAKFVNAAVDLRVFYDPTKTTKSASEIRQTVLTAISTYSETKLNKFNIPLRQSLLSTIVDECDVSVVSNDMIIDPIIEILPNLSGFNSPSFSFMTELATNQPLNEGYLATKGYRPAVISGNFVSSGTYVYLMDNGLGALHAITSNPNNRRVFKRNVGTVVYETGDIKISNLLVSSYDSTGIKFRGYTTNNDIDEIRDRILTIREKDINIKVQEVIKR